MPMVTAVRQPTSTSLDLRATRGLPASSDGTWFGFAIQETSGSQALLSVVGAGAAKWTLRSDAGTGQIVVQGDAGSLTGSTWNKREDAIAVAIVCSGVNAQYFTRLLPKLVSSSSALDRQWIISPAFPILSAAFVPTTIGVFSTVAVSPSMQGCMWGWRFWPAPYNPKTVDEFNMEFKSVLPARRGATIIWPLRGNLVDASKNGANLVPNTGLQFSTGQGCILSTGQD